MKQSVWSSLWDTILIAGWCIAGTLIVTAYAYIYLWAWFGPF